MKSGQNKEKKKVVCKKGEVDYNWFRKHPAFIQPGDTTEADELGDLDEYETPRDIDKQSNEE